MSDKLATTTFEDDGNTIIPTIDVYETEPVTVPINRVVTTVEASLAQAQGATTDLLTETAKNAVEKARDSLRQTLSPQGIIDIATGKTTFDKESLISGLPKTKEAALDLIKDAVKAPLGQIKDLEKLKGDLLTDMLGAVGFGGQSKALADGILGVPGAKDPVSQLIDSNPKLKILHDTEKFLRNDADLSSAQGIINTVNALTGNSELAQVINAEAQFAVLGRLAMQASDLNLPFVIDSIVEQVDVEDRPGFLLKNADQAIKNGDVSYIAQLTQYASAEQIASMSPEPAATFLQQYRLPKDGRTYPEWATDLITILNSLDSNWATYHRNGVTISNLEAFKKASKDAKTVLRYSAYRVPAMIADSYPTLPIKTVIKRDFPYAAVR